MWEEIEKLKVFLRSTGSFSDPRSKRDIWNPSSVSAEQVYAGKCGKKQLKPFALWMGFRTANIVQKKEVLIFWMAIDINLYPANYNKKKKIPICIFLR